MDIAQVKPEGQCIVKIYAAPQIPTVELDHEVWLQKILNEKLYEKSEADIQREIDEFCNEKFNVYGSIGKTAIAPNDIPYITYAIGVDITDELYEDTRDCNQSNDTGCVWTAENGWRNKKKKIDGNDIILGSKIYILYCLFETLKILAENNSNKKDTLYWRLKPYSEIQHDVWHSKRTVVGRMRLTTD